MKLKNLLVRDANNLDIFRFIAACMVIYGHAYTLTPEPGKQDWIQSLLGFEHSGSLAVKIFFFISGLVVTNSLITKRDPISFAVARFFRIWPALIAVVIISALIVGPIFTSLSLRDYFGSKETFSYIYSNISLKIVYVLPGVFDSLPYKQAINGSLWTLPYEAAAYIALLSAYLIGLFENKWIATVVLLVILVDSMAGNAVLITWLPHSLAYTMLAPCFAFGALLALHKDVIQINLGSALGGWAIYYVFRFSSLTHYFLYSAVFLTILYLSSIKSIVSIKIKSDISYGIYLWGFLVQQILAYYFHDRGVRFNQVAAMVISIIIAAISWRYLESKCIRYGQWVGRAIKVPSIADS